MLLDGKKLAQKRREKLKKRVDQVVSPPQLTVVLVGKDPASRVYVGHKERQCKEVGIESQVLHLPDSISERELQETIEKLNKDEGVDGILVQLPLPQHLQNFDPLESIDPKKDVDGLTAKNMGLMIKGEAYCEPCTPKGIVALLKENGFDFNGKKAAVLGRSQIVGWPMAWMLTRENATVTICHSRTKNLEEVLKDSDLVVVAVGKPNFLDASSFKEGAWVIDVGIHRGGDGKLLGDVDKKGLEEKNISYSPVPGGVGPMTVSLLLENVIQLCEKKLGGSL